MAIGPTANSNDGDNADNHNDANQDDAFKNGCAALVFPNLPNALHVFSIASCPRNEPDRLRLFGNESM
jgi:hypothetical protein